MVTARREGESAVAARYDGSVVSNHADLHF